MLCRSPVSSQKHSFTRTCAVKINTGVYRALTKKYPELGKDKLLMHLVATPGETGKWFATAKTLILFDLATRLA